MKRSLVVLMAVLVLAGCGKKNEKQETMVPQGMQQTTVTSEAADSAGALGDSLAEAAGQMPDMPASAGEVPLQSLDEPTGTPPRSEPQPVRHTEPERPARTATAPPAGGSYAVQVGAFERSVYADKRVAALGDAGISARIETAQVNGVTYHRVIVPGLPTLDEARSLAARVERDLGFATLVRKR